MTLENRIIEWANNRNLYENTTPRKQLDKLMEEIDEWVEAVQINDTQNEQLELGDMYVALVNLAAKRGYSLERCGWLTYEKIKDRTGKMVDGTFVKDVR